MSRLLDACQGSIELLDGLLSEAIEAQPRPWTAMHGLARDLVALKREEAGLLDGEGSTGAPTPEELRLEILSLSDEEVEVVAAALEERRTGGRR